MKKNKKNGRVVIKNVLILFLIICAFGAYLTMTNAKEERLTSDYVVSRSDTLWSISTKICNNSSDNNLNVQSVVKEIKKINNLENNNIFEGQSIKLPIY